MKSREAAYNHLLDKQMNIINDTNDLDIENKRLSYTFDTINKQPEMYKIIQTQQQKLANTQELNDVLNNKLDIQKKTKELQLENSMMIKTSNIINGDEPYKDDNYDEKQPKMKLKKKTKKNENENENSLFDVQLEALETEKAKFETEFEEKKLFKQRKEEEKHHQQVMVSQQAQLNAVSYNSNNNNNSNNHDTIMTMQTNYKIEQQNREQEEYLRIQALNQQIANEIKQIQIKRDSKSNVWKNTQSNYKI